jgi:hypothetical protein
MFLNASRLGPAEFWRLVVWDLLITAVGTSILLSFALFAPASTWGASVFVGLGWGFLTFLMFAAWLRFLVTGTLAPGVPIRFGVEEGYGLLALVLLGVVGSALGLVFLALVGISSVLGVGAAGLMLFGLPIGIFGIYVSLRATPLVAHCMLEHRLALRDGWKAMDGQVGSVFVAMLIIGLASILLQIVFAVFGMMVESVLGVDVRQIINAHPLAAQNSNLFDIAITAILVTATAIPLRLMQYSLVAYAAVYIADLKSVWINGLLELED